MLHSTVPALPLIVVGPGVQLEVVAEGVVVAVVLVDDEPAETSQTIP